MFKIIVYSYIKKVNSTKRVTKNDALTNTEMDCQVNWNGCGIVNPHIRINYGIIKSPTNFNYAYIPAFKRYYFCRDWILIDNLWEADLQEDFLATWRDDILNYTAFVLRSASKYNSHIADNRCVMTSTVQILSQEIPCPYNLAGGGELPAGWEGYYIVGIIGKNLSVGGAVGGVTYYAFNPNNMQMLCNALLSDVNYMGIDWDKAKMFMTEDILKTLYNPIQYIASAMWFPDFAIDVAEQVNQVEIGYWTVPAITCFKIPANSMVSTTVRQITVPKHPQSGTLGDWCNLSPYSSYQVHVPPYGLLDFPADELQGQNTISVQYVVDYATGNARIMLASLTRFVQIVNFQLGVEVQVSQVVQNPLKALTSGIAYQAKVSSRITSGIGAASLLKLSDITQTATGYIQDAMAYIGDMADAVTPTVQSHGSNGARAWYYTGEIFIRLSGKFIMLTDMGNDVNGRPLCAMEKLSNLSGYTQCENASVSIEGTGVEQDMVNAYLNRGVYLE